MLALGRTFKYEALSYRNRKPFKLVLKVAEPYDFEDAEIVFEGKGRTQLTTEQLDRATHFFNESEGGDTVGTTRVVFPRKRFAELVKKGSTSWMTNWGEDGKLVKLKRVAVPPYKAKVEGTLQALPAIGAAAPGIKISILDDAACPILLSYDEKPYPVRLLEIGRPADKTMLKYGQTRRR